MLKNNERYWLENIFNNLVKFDEPMSLHTSFRIGGGADAYIAPKNQQELISIVTWARINNINVFILGGGTNLLVKDSGIKGIVVDTKDLNSFNAVKKDNDCVLISAEAGFSMRKLCSYALKNGLKGMNFALGIPGTIGGGIMMNAGTSLGSISDIIESITFFDDKGNIKRFPKKDIGFAYRSIGLKDIVVLEAKFCLMYSDSKKLKLEAREFFKSRIKKQPQKVFSAGCIFKNPLKGESAGALIDKAGLKGQKIGGAQISYKHANFIVNTGKALASDVLHLIDITQKIVLDKYGINLEPEVKIVS